MWARDMEERETQTDNSFCAGSSVTNNAFTLPTAVGRRHGPTHMHLPHGNRPDTTDHLTSGHTKKKP